MEGSLQYSSVSTSCTEDDSFLENIEINKDHCILHLQGLEALRVIPISF